MPAAVPVRLPDLELASRDDVVHTDDMPCERGANISPSTRVHARVTLLRRVRLVCGAFVPAVTRVCPRVPRSSQDGKEGVDGSSPSEGSKIPASGDFCCLDCYN